MVARALTFEFDCAVSTCLSIAEYQKKFGLT
jgi:hypothetical protein